MTMTYNSEQLGLLLSYLAVIGVWFAIPSVSLLLNKDHRWPWAILILGVIVIGLILAYIFRWKVLFPVPTTEQIYRIKEEEEKNTK